MSRHTPWIAHEYGSPVGHWYVRNSNDETINYPLAEREALLFAAAPDLLAALKRVLSDDEVALSRPDYEFARAAILKADGEGLAHLRSTAMMGAG